MHELAQTLLAHTLAAQGFPIHVIELKTAVAAFLVGIVVGITGMGGGALMTPALIFLGVGDASSVVTADLTAAAVYKSGGAAVHWREGSPNLRLAGWLIVGSVPMAFLGPHVVGWINPHADPEKFLQLCIGFALLFAATTYALRLYIQLRRTVHTGPAVESEPRVHPIPTILVGGLGGLLVGITSVGSGSIIMIAMLMLYPTLSAVKLVGTDLVQAVPLVLSAAVANILTHGLDWSIVIPLTLGSVPGCIIGAKIAPRVPASVIRRGIVVVLTMSGLALLDKAGWAPLGAGDNQTHPVLIALVGIGLVGVVPIVWGLLRKREGLPMFGTPTVAQIESAKPAQRAAGRGAHDETRTPTDTLS
ncbi:MAG: sulfite exporter TauE/SafE family protein [Nocardioidaceae bacterium]